MRLASGVVASRAITSSAAATTTPWHPNNLIWLSIFSMFDDWNINVFVWLEKEIKSISNEFNLSNSWTGLKPLASDGARLNSLFLSVGVSAVSSNYTFKRSRELGPMIMSIGRTNYLLQGPGLNRPAYRLGPSDRENLLERDIIPAQDCQQFWPDPKII